ncbi:hypothetical protein B9G55_10805 [Saccharibacillus sp. O16]|nr:hypothetical protein B9G55_10805 [Saccharibacillus sp. O16]
MERIMMKRESTGRQTAAWKPRCFALFVQLQAQLELPGADGYPELKYPLIYKKDASVYTTVIPTEGVKGMFDMTKIGLTLARMRKESGMTQMELADRMGISYQAVSSWERGTTMPDISKLPLLADSLGVSIDQILNGGRGSELVRKIVEGPVEEKFAPGEVTVEEFQELAPLLPTKQADAVFSRTVQPGSLSELVSLAPFISEEVLGECALQASGSVALFELASLAPFLPTSVIDELALRGYADSGVSSITTIAPFMSQEGLDAVVNRLSSDGASPAELMTLAPFMSRENLNALALPTDGSSLPPAELMALAPFLESDTISELANRAMQNADFKGLTALAPFMDSGRLDTLARSLVPGGAAPTPPAKPASGQSQAAPEAAAPQVPFAEPRRGDLAAHGAPPAHPAAPQPPAAQPAEADRAPHAERPGESGGPPSSGHASFADPRR